MMTPLIKGINLDAAGRCKHYHKDADIAALKCSQCDEYYAYYQCHDSLEDHKFVASNKDDYPVMCGVCRRLLDFDEYTSGACPNCHHGFNPRCKLHYEIYFED